MENLYTLLFIFQILIAVVLIGMILIQHGKGADAGAAFGSGASSTVFGSRGTGSFLTKLTTILAIVFLANSLSLAYLASRSTQQIEIDSLYTETQQIEIPMEQKLDEISTEIPVGQDSNLQKLPAE